MGEYLKLLCRGRVHRQMKVYCMPSLLGIEPVPLIYKLSRTFLPQSRCACMSLVFVLVLGSGMRIRFKLLAVSVLEVKFVLKLNPMQSKGM